MFSSSHHLMSLFNLACHMLYILCQRKNLIAQPESLLTSESAGMSHFAVVSELTVSFQVKIHKRKLAYESWTDC